MNDKVSGNFKKTLEKRFRLSGGCLFVGGLALVLSGTVLPASSLSAMVCAFYAGGGTGLATMGAVLCIYNWYLWLNPEKAKAAHIKEHDERECGIRSTAAKWAFYVSFFGLIPAMLIAAPFNLTVFWTLYFVFVSMGAVMGGSVLLAKWRL